jgi:transcriptional regulator with XRE-family HTH domain
MTSSKLHNYLRTNRKRLALSQVEVGFLLGSKVGTKVCRYERFTRTPSLETALAYEVIYRRPVSELFGGLYQTIEQEVTTRAKTLAERNDLGQTERQHIHRRETLTKLITGRPNNPINK